MCKGVRVEGNLVWERSFNKKSIEESVEREVESRLFRILKFIFKWG